MCYLGFLLVYISCAQLKCPIKTYNLSTVQLSLYSLIDVPFNCTDSRYRPYALGTEGLSGMSGPVIVQIPGTGRTVLRQRRYQEYMGCIRSVRSMLHFNCALAFHVFAITLCLHTVIVHQCRGAVRHYVTNPHKGYVRYYPTSILLFRLSYGTPTLILQHLSNGIQYAMGHHFLQFRGGAMIRHFHKSS